MKFHQSLAVVAAFSAVASAAWAQRVITADQLTVLSDQADLCHDPVIAADGSRATAAWTGLFEGRKRIFAAEFDGSSWQPAAAMDEATEGDSSDPVVRYAPDGQPAIVWAHDTAGSFTLQFSPSPGAPAEVIASSPLRMETPSLGFDSTGQPVAAWAEGGGGKFAVIVARRGEAGWVRTVLSEGLGAYDILPTVIGGSVMRVYFYSLDNQDFHLAAAEWNGSDWRDSTVGILGAVPANRLPYLYDTQSVFGPGAVWVEPVTGGEIVLTADPRGGIEQLVQPLPGAANGRQLDPDATSDPFESSYAWIEETPAGADIMVLRAEELVRVTGVPHVTQPRIALGENGALHLIFVSDQVEGGTGNVYGALLP